MVYINRKKCVYERCSNIPIYKIKEKSQDLYSRPHKLKNILTHGNYYKQKSYNTKKCIYDGCFLQPNYNFIGNKKAIYCSVHKLEGMIDIKSKNECLIIVTGNLLIIYKQKKRGIVVNINWKIW